MRAELTALRALLEPLGYPVLFVSAPSGTSMPYLIVSTSAGSPSEETSIRSEVDHWEAFVQVRAVAQNPESGVLRVQERVREVLCPDSLPLALDVPGRVATLVLFDSRPIDVDRDVTPHPAFGVDIYRLVSVPA